MAYVNFVSSLYLPILKCLFWACNGSKLHGFISRLQILVVECSLQTSSWKQPSLEARSPSPYKGPRFIPTQREHHQICSTWKGERGDKVIVFKCKSHSSPLLHQIVGSGNPKNSGIIIRTLLNSLIFISTSFWGKEIMKLEGNPV